LGAGNIGRGFLGQLFFESGYSTTFVDVLDDLVSALNARGEYPLRIVDRQTYALTIRDVSAVHASHIEAVARALAEADLAATAVGTAALPKVAPAIAAGIARRFAHPGAPPLDIIVCENLMNAGRYLRKQVKAHLDPAQHNILDEKVGFVETSIGRMVPVMTEAAKAEDPLLLCVEEYCELPVDAQGFRGPIPELKNLLPRTNFEAYVARKLFVHNMGHAAAAYLGYLKGHEFIWQSVEDPSVLGPVEAALNETCAGLVVKYGLDPDELKAHAEDLLRRYDNRGLGDQVARIAKDPLRKLGVNDRLIGAARMCLEQGIEPAHTAFAAAAAIRYDYPSDPAAQALQDIVRREGMTGVFRRVCHIPEDSRLAQLVVEGLERLRREGWVKPR
jgi:mannitol-1-phosphate 5-dehydrogenase